MLLITAGKGFHMTFANGWTVSVQFGRGNYCANYGRPLSLQPPRDLGCQNAEVSRWPREGLAEEPRGWQTPDEVAAFITETANL